MHFYSRRSAARLLLAPLLLPVAGSLAQDRDPGIEATVAPERRLPDEVVTEHRMMLGGTDFAFRARAGAVRLLDANTRAVTAELAFIAYERPSTDPASRPVVFAINGGPGAASAWLGIGALGPWRLPMNAPAPSAEPRLIDNQETWLPFADIVLIDTPGTGYSRARDPKAARSTFYTVDGDITAIAAFIREWLTSHGRLASPKYIAAESYGGIRAPRLAHVLSQRDNVGISGLILVSPLLDVSSIEGGSVLVDVARLPSYAAVNRKARDRRALADVEAYAAGPYLVDLLKGPGNAAAQSRLARHVGAFTGLDRSYVLRSGARIDRPAFARERLRTAGKVLSIYDGAITGFDPAPTDYYSVWDDPMLDNLRAPVGAAMTLLTAERLKWPVSDLRYEVLNYTLVRQWDWGTKGRLALESVSDLRSILASDPRVTVTITHGLNDLVTPYFGSQLLVNALPDYGRRSRIKLVTYAAGHMFYSGDEGRRGLRDEARTMILAER